MYFYSASTPGFFHSTIHGKGIPADARPVKDEQYQALMAAQARGEQIVPDANGDPISEPMKVKPHTGRVWRDAELKRTDAFITRHREEIEASQPTTLAADQYSRLLQYRRALRDWPAQSGFPDHKPVRPNFVKP